MTYILCFCSVVFTTSRGVTVALNVPLLDTSQSLEMMAVMTPVTTPPIVSNKNICEKWKKNCEIQYFLGWYKVSFGELKAANFRSLTKIVTELKAFKITFTVIQVLCMGPIKIFLGIKSVVNRICYLLQITEP